MGDDITIDKKKDNIFWIDSNVYNSENEETYKTYHQEIKNLIFFVLIQ